MSATRVDYRRNHRTSRHIPVHIISRGAGDLLPGPVLVGHRQQLEGLGRPLRGVERPLVRRRTSTGSRTSSSSSPTAGNLRAVAPELGAVRVRGRHRATVLAVLAGYGFAKYKFAGRRFGFSVLLGAVMVPTTALVIPTFILFSQVGLTNTIWSVILPTLLNPFGVYLLNVYARDAVPDELLDAARVDGAGSSGRSSRSRCRCCGRRS